MNALSVSGVSGAPVADMLVFPKDSSLPADSATWDAEDSTYGHRGIVH